MDYSVNNYENENELGNDVNLLLNFFFMHF